MWKTLGTFASFFWALTVQPGRVPSRRGKPRWAERCAAYWGVGGGAHCNAISSFEATGEWIHGIANGNGFAMPYRLQRFFTLFSAKQKSCSPKRTAHCIISDYARVTLPERRQRVQTFTRFTSPSTIARTVCTLGFQAALVWRLEWLTLLPDMMPLPHTSQICAIWFDLLHRISI